MSEALPETDNEPGEVKVVPDSDPDHGTVVTDFDLEKDLSAYGHGPPSSVHAAFPGLSR